MISSTESYHLIFEERPQYLYARVTADTITRETAMAYLTEVAARLKASRRKRLMLERCIPVMLSDADLFNTTRDFLEMIGSTKSAFINPYLSIDEAMDFAMTIGNNRGANYRLFNCPILAEEWLLDADLPE